MEYAESFITFTREDVETFNFIVNDTNPIHFDREFCETTVFKAPIVPGLLTSGAFGGLLGSNLPDGAILLGMTLGFIAPVYIGERVKVTMSLEKFRTDKPIATYKLICYKDNNKVAINGEAIVRI
jgi:acyl dehydratase